MAQITVTSQDNQAAERTVLTDGTATTIYTCPDKQTAKALGVNAYNDSGSAQTVEVAVFAVPIGGGSRVVIKLQSASIANGAFNYFDLHAEKMSEDDEIRVTGAADVHVSYNALESGR